MSEGWSLASILLTGLDVFLIYFVLYRVLLIIKGTRAVPMLIGLMAIALLYGLTQPGRLDLPTFNWLLEQFIANLLLIVIVLFQSDIRKALASFGQTQFLSSIRSGSGSQTIDEVVKACSALASQRIGALIAVQREADLEAFTAEGTRVDARVSKELIYSLFVPERQNPLHDGAVVIQAGKLTVAGVFLPMSVNPSIDRGLGTRHRAGLGLAEETDAVVIIVSEERGAISVACDGELDMDVSPSALRELLTNLFIRRPIRRFRRGAVRHEAGLVRQAETDVGGTPQEADR